MEVGGRQIQIKENLQLIKERNAHHIGEIGKGLLKWIEADDADPKELDKLEARWKKVCGEIFEGEVPPLKELGLVGVNQVATDFFVFASITKQSAD